MTFQTGVTEFAEFVGSEIKRIERKFRQMVGVANPAIQR